MLLHTNCLCLQVLCTQFCGKNDDNKDVSLLWFMKTQLGVTRMYLKLVQKACAGNPPALQLLIPLDVSYVLASASFRTLCLCIQRCMYRWVANSLLKQDVGSVELPGSFCWVIRLCSPPRGRVSGLAMSEFRLLEAWR